MQKVYCDDCMNRTQVYTWFTRFKNGRDYFLFPKLKTARKGAFYDDVPTIQSAVTQVLKNIPKTEFKKSMDKLVDRSKRCFESNGTYFE